MNSFELNNFLQEYTFFEKFYLSNVNPNDINSTKSFIKNTYYDEFINKKFPPFNGEPLDNFFIDFNKRHINKTIRMNIDSVDFICHPRCSIKTPEHQHDHIEMIYVYSGEFRQIIKGTEICMKKGEVCILDTNVLHSIEPTSENDIIIYCHMSKKYLDSILIDRLSENDLLSCFFIHAIYQSKNYNDYIVFKSGESEKIAKLLEFVLCEYFDKSFRSYETINSYLVIIFSELLKVYENQTNSQNYALLKNTKITDIILYIQNNYKDATLASVANHFHFHPNYLNSVIKKFKGENFTFILQEAKLKKACFFLKNSDIPIVQVSRNIGYENINFFYTLFKKNYGCTPAEYRKNFQSK